MWRSDGVSLFRFYLKNSKCWNKNNYKECQISFARLRGFNLNLCLLAKKRFLSDIKCCLLDMKFYLRDLKQCLPDVKGVSPQKRSSYATRCTSTLGSPTVMLMTFCITPLNCCLELLTCIKNQTDTSAITYFVTQRWRCCDLHRWQNLWA